jgi:hypothetical protein
MFSLTQIKEIFKNEIKYKDWEFHVSDNPCDIWVQIRFMAPDNFHGGEAAEQHCRKWRLSIHMSKTELVRTAFLAVIQAERHESEETFLYKGKAVFNSHLDIDKLAGLHDENAMDYRK